MLNRTPLVIASFAFVSMIAAARANDIGVQVYIQPWDPQHYDQDHVRDFYHDPKKVSQVITDAWKVSGLLFPKLQKALADYQLPAGLHIAAVKLTSDPITDFTVRPKGDNAGTLHFTVPNITLTFYVVSDAVTDLDKITGEIASAALTPSFSASFDLTVTVALVASGNSLQAADVHATPSKATITPLNDAGKALKGVNDLVDFFGGPNFQRMVEDQFNNKDLASQSLDQINQAFDLINAQLQLASSKTGQNLARLWADSNRLTFYLAPLPLTNIPSGGQMAGSIRWDLAVIPDATCPAFNVVTDVQTGPRPLESSDGETYGDAPTSRVGKFSARAAGRAGPAGKLNACDYTVTEIAKGWFHKVQATANTATSNPISSGSPYTGRLHSMAYLKPVGWDGLSVVPDASNKDYEVQRGLEGGKTVGNPHPVAPGEKNQGVSVINNPALQSLPAEVQRPAATVPGTSINPTQGVPPNAEQPTPSGTAAPGPSRQFPKVHRPSSAGAVSAAQPSNGSTGGPTPGSNVQLNPQPLPPKVIQPANTGVAGSSPGSNVQLNPQPLPPKIGQPTATTATAVGAQSAKDKGKKPADATTLPGSATTLTPQSSAPTPEGSTNEIR